MEQLKRYRTVIEKVLSECCDWAKRSNQSGIEQYVSFDQERDHYIWVSLGWDGKRREFSIVAYLRIDQGKIWIETDWTKQGIADALLDAGIAKSEIVLGFQHPSKRALTEFSTGIDTRISNDISDAIPTALSNDRLHASHSP